jgi:hypothetical protein
MYRAAVFKTKSYIGWPKFITTKTQPTHTPTISVKFYDLKFITKTAVNEVRGQFPSVTAVAISLRSGNGNS